MVITHLVEALVDVDRTPLPGEPAALADGSIVALLEFVKLPAGAKCDQDIHGVAS